TRNRAWRWILWVTSSGVARLKIEGGGVDAVTQSGRRGTVREHVSQMRIAARALDFDTVHTVTEIVDAGDGAVAYRLETAPPAAAGGKLGVRIEKRFVATSAVIDAGHLGVVVLAGEGAFGGAQPADLKLLVRKLLTPGFERFFQLFHRYTSGGLFSYRRSYER